MCIHCHQGLGDERIIVMFRESIDNPRFEVWNSTSVNHMFIAAANVNGPIAKKLALELLEKFIEYAETPSEEGVSELSRESFKTHSNYQKQGLMPMLSIETMQKVYITLKNLDKPQSVMKDEFYHKDYLSRVIKC